MLRPEAVVADLRDRRLLWDASPGVVGMRGELAILCSSVSAAIAEMTSVNSVDEWRMPQVMSFETLERAKYFESFPHWLTAASHLGEDEAGLERIARSERPGIEAAKSLDDATAALPPAVCYHTYAALADSTIDSPVMMTAEEPAGVMRGFGLLRWSAAGRFGCARSSSSVLRAARKRFVRAESPMLPRLLNRLDCVRELSWPRIRSSRRHRAERRCCNE